MGDHLGQCGSYTNDQAHSADYYREQIISIILSHSTVLLTHCVSHEGFNPFRRHNLSSLKTTHALTPLGISDGPQRTSDA
jgi:hypothetical protein